MREGVSKPEVGVDEFSPTVAPTSRPESSKLTEAATGVPLRAEDTADTLVGAVLAERYRIERRVGAGGMGAVYVGIHLTLAKKVAVKVIQPRLGADETIAQRFIQEARAASAIGHEHIVQITDFGSTPEGGSFLVMEYLDGEDLSETLRNSGPLPWQRVIHLGEQIAWALAAAHKHGIVHRDIKPANCYRVPREHDQDFIKVLDFGLAKVMVDDRREGESLTHTGMLLGTPGYIAPELYRGLKADHRVDIYALGALMHKLLTGELPPMGGSDEGEPMRGIPAPDVVATVLGKALRENPEQRWSTAHELAQALRSIPRPTASDEPTLLQPITGGTSTSTRREPSGTTPVSARGEPVSTANLSVREPTPVSFSSLVSVERDGQRVRLSLGIPALIMLVALVGGLVFFLTRADDRDAPGARDRSNKSAQPLAPPVAAPPQPAQPANPPPPAPPTPPPPEPVVTPPVLTPPVVDPAPVDPAPVDPAPVETRASRPLKEGTRERLGKYVTSNCLKDSEWFFKVDVEWKTDATGAILRNSVKLPSKQPQTISPQIKECALLKIKSSKFQWEPDKAHALQIEIGKRPAG